MRSFSEYFALFRKILAFAILPASSALVPLVAIPIITGEFGGQVWVSVAVGISIGSAGSVLVELGWGLNGSIRVARAASSARKNIFGLALVTKIIVLSLVAIPVVALCVVLGLDNIGVTVLVAIGYLSAGLSPAWYFIGCGSPVKILICEVAPRSILVLFSCVLMLTIDAPVEVYGVALVLSSVFSVMTAIFLEKITVGDVFGHSRIRIVYSIRQQRQALFARAASALYIALPVTLVGFVNPSSLLTFSAAERMLRMFLSVLQSVPNAFQSYVGSANGSGDLKSRIKGTVVLNFIIGVAGAVIFVSFGSTAAEFLFSGLVIIPTACLWLCAGIVICTCSSRAVGSLGLVAVRDVKSISISASLGAVIGVAGILAGGSVWGAIGALSAMLIAETVVLGYQLMKLSQALTRNTEKRALALQKEVESR